MTKYIGFNGLDSSFEVNPIGFQDNSTEHLMLSIAPQSNSNLLVLKTLLYVSFFLEKT